jgi:site-specific DNA recombinase
MIAGRPGLLWADAATAACRQRATLDEAGPDDRAEVYRQLGLRLTYHPEHQKVRVQAQPDADSYGDMVCVRRGT